MIQDTSFLIDILAGDEAALDMLDRIERDRKPEKVSSVTVFELYEGIERSDQPDDEKEAVLDVLDSKAVLPANHGVMRRAGRLSGELYVAGEPIDREDCVIAATAIDEGDPVVTRNTNHFDRIPGLDVETY